MNKYILKTKRECDNEWEEFKFKNINKAKEKLKGLVGVYKYKIYQETESGTFNI